MRLLALFALIACSGGDGSPPPDDTGGDDTGDTSPGVDVCGTLGMPELAFTDVEDDPSLKAMAADFTVATEDGDWNFKEQWSGCEVYLFIQDEPEQATGWPKELWQRDVDTLFERLPVNTQVFFLSTFVAGSDGRDESMDRIHDNVDEVFADMTDEDVAWWTPRVHFVTDRASNIDGWLGDLMGNPGWGIGIDRFQRIRYIGSYADPSRYNSDYGWFEPNISMAANEAIYYNYEAEREAALEADGATVVQVFDGTTDVVGGWIEKEVELPDAATLATFDTLTIDASMNCQGEGEYGYCPAWDYMAYLYACSMETGENAYESTSCQPYVGETLGLCGDATTACRADTDCGEGGTCTGYVASISADVVEENACLEPNGTSSGYYSCRSDGSGYDAVCSCNFEIGRWITTYHREGRWVYDTSAMLPILSRGGTQRFAFETSGPYELDLDLRFSNQGKAAAPQETTYLFDGGDIGLSYNDNHPPIEMDIPADAVKVELATVISGHGMNDPGNCAEFCNIVHTFTINGDTANSVVFDFPMAGNELGCQEQIEDGTVPNQYGTWWYGRNGWCPGKQVDTVMTDITSLVIPGATNTFEYEATYQGDDYPGWATIRMRSWIVVSR